MKFISHVDEELFILTGKVLPKLKSKKVKDKNVVLPKTRHFDETLHPTHLDETIHPTHSIPSVAAIVPAEVPNFKKTVLGLRQDRSETRLRLDGPTKRTIQRHDRFRPTVHQSSQNVRQGISEGDVRWDGSYNRGLKVDGVGMQPVESEGKAEKGDRRFLLQISPDTVSIVPKSKHRPAQTAHVTGDSRRRIHKHRGNSMNTLDFAGTSRGSTNYGGVLDGRLLPLGNAIGYGNLDLASLAMINSKSNALYHQQLQSNRKPILDFTKQSNGLLQGLPANPDRLLPNSLLLLGSGSKRWERNRFNRKKERHHHNETEEFHHHYGKIQFNKLSACFVLNRSFLS